MIRFALTILCVCVMASSSYGQLFPRAPWNRAKSNYANSAYSVSVDVSDSGGSTGTVSRSYGSTGSAVASTSGSYSSPPTVGYGSTGSVAIAQSVPMPPSVGSVISPAIAESAMSAERRTFRQRLLSEARAARDAGTMSELEFAAVRMASANPIVLARLKSAVDEDAAVSGGKIDWAKLFEIILRLIDLFS